MVNDDIGVTIGTDVILRISKQESDDTPTKLSRYRLLLGKLYAGISILTDKMDEMKLEEHKDDLPQGNLFKRPTT